MKKWFHTLALACAMALLTWPAGAEIIVLPSGQIGVMKLSHEPRRGLSMQQVRQHFGVPLRLLPPLRTAPGYPTIIRWIYPDFTVYFGNGQVINNVAHPHAVATTKSHTPQPFQ